MARTPRYQPYEQPSGGWGSVTSLMKKGRQGTQTAAAARLLAVQNKPRGFMCVSCAWAKPAEPHPAEFCENGAKATLWETSSQRATPAFFARHPVEELLTWSDFELESAGRLTEPLRYDRASDRYLRVSWKEAFEAIGAELRTLEPNSVVFYTSGRAALETSYMYQLFARLYGTNNLPDSSNMCHETTSVALPESLGVPVGTVTLDDFAHTDCILAFGQNVGTCAPRMLHQLQEVRERGVPVVVFNPLKEKGWTDFVNPQRPGQMLTNRPTEIATRYLQVRPAADIAAMMGIAKALFALDEEARTRGGAPVIDWAFIEEHTHGFEAFREQVCGQHWDELERASGLARADVEEVAGIYARAERAIAIYGMGLTQHRYGVDTVQMLVNLLLMRGHIGKTGAGILPVRGHSNVQGQRTVGISEKPSLVPLDRLGELYGFEPPREEGTTTVVACQGIVEGTIRGFVSLGGNFARAVPDSAVIEPAWRRMDLSVQIATKLNRSHLLTAGKTYLLPCLGRSEIDLQNSGPQTVSMEDSTACIHASRGRVRPASRHLLSEPRIVAELAKATVPDRGDVRWDTWVADYGRVRDAIERTYPDDFHDFNKRLGTPGGFPRPLPARERRWNTSTGKANFKLPRQLHASFADDGDDAVFRLVTLRSNDQFNTTVYGYDDRFRGIHGSRMVVMVNAQDMSRLGLEEGSMVTLTTAAEDGVARQVAGLRVVPYDVPPGSLAAYYPECNALIPLWQYDDKAKTPACKSVPVRVLPEAATAGAD